MSLTPEQEMQLALVETELSNMLSMHHSLTDDQIIQRLKSFGNTLRNIHNQVVRASLPVKERPKL